MVDFTFLPGVGPWEEAVLLFGDASGGPCSSIKRFRAVGCALVRLEPSDFSEVASHTRTLLHDEQAVPTQNIHGLQIEGRGTTRNTALKIDVVVHYVSTTSQFSGPCCA